MAKQIKIGFDKTPAPITKVFQQLVDIEGTPLFDDAGNPLVTEDNAVATGTLLSDNSLSIFVNNENSDEGGGPVAIEEQFKEFSEVSSSLLGVPRAEEQLSLFSDVATYGLDVDNWDASDFFSEPAAYPREWYEKEHPVYGRRSGIKFYEGSDEQALYIKGFPSQYTFPRGPIELKQNLPSDNFIAYMNFIAIGRYLYDRFAADGSVDFAERNFISPQVASIVSQNAEISFSDGDNPITFNKSLNDLNNNLSNQSQFFDVVYNKESLQDSFDAIERWTVAYDKIKDDLDFSFPPLSADMINIEKRVVGEADADAIDERGYKAFREYFLIRAYLASADTRPGGDFLQEYYGILQSKRTFRYQPGRVSGFTFGTRILAGDPNRQDQVAEFGCANDTDMYMFQLKGSTFNIVRRSTIQMPRELLERQGLVPPENFQSFDELDKVVIKGVGNTNKLWETVIPRASFNGDRLDGNGDSGYIIRGFDDVTMYKIEFSWYGAIGAKFYAYVPVGVGECRWVLLHTLVIENGLGEPILENPDFRFRYLVQTNNTEHIKNPMYLYKYGSSCYIDGGDEGTLRLSTSTVDTKTFNNRTSILGILPKESILNMDGIPKENFMKSYPSTVSVTSDRDCRIDFEEILGSPQGVHYNYSPSIIMSGAHPKTRQLKLQYTFGGQGNGRGAVNVIQPANSKSIVNGSKILGFNQISDDNAELDYDAIHHAFLVDTSSSDVNINGSTGGYYKDYPIIGEMTIDTNGVVTIDGDTTVDGLPPDETRVRIVSNGNQPGTSSFSATGDYLLDVDVTQPNNGDIKFKLKTTSGNDISVSTGGTISSLDIFKLTEYPTDFSGLQVGDTLKINAVDYVIKKFDSPNEYDSTGKTNLTLTSSAGSQTFTEAKLIHKINSSEDYTHIIADGVYGRYVDSENLVYRRGNPTGAQGDEYNIIPAESEDSEFLSGEIRSKDIELSDPTSVFNSYLSSYNTIVASDTPITSNKFKIHFLNPDAKDVRYGSRHFAEFLVGVTPYKPLAHNDSSRSDSDPEVKFNKPGGVLEFDVNEFPTIEYCHAHNQFDFRRKVDLYEADRFYGNRLNIDPRLDANDNRLQTHDGVAHANGDMSTVTGEVAVNSYQFLAGSAGIERTIDPEVGQARIKLTFETNGAPGESEIIPNFSEVGLNFGPLTLDNSIGGTPVKFRSSMFYPNTGDADARPFVYIDDNETIFNTLNALSDENRAIQTKSIILKDDWRAVSIRERTALQGESERFLEKRFKVIKAVSFNTQPLYPVFALSDYARVNCVVVEEISQDGTVKTHTPTFITEDTLWNTNVSIATPRSSSDTKTPSAFNNTDTNTLSACRYDSSTTNSLRPGNVIYSTFVGANETLSIDLENIFSRDRKGISRGALNNRAVFLTANSLDGSDGSVQLSLTSKEQ